MAGRSPAPKATEQSSFSAWGFMKLRKREISGREKDEASIKLLEQLMGKLYSGDLSVARRAAFNLSWMQEDGLDILKEALFSGATRRTKIAAAYGLRRTQGRMKKMALEVFKQGLTHSNNDTKYVCRGALALVSGKVQKKPPSQRAARERNFNIKEISSKKRAKSKSPAAFQKLTGRGGLRPKRAR